jgi:hypothetical protein
VSDAINFRAVQDHFGLSSIAPVEKDWNVVRAMQAIVGIGTGPFRLVFAGGTALARAPLKSQASSASASPKRRPRSWSG